VFGKGRNLKLKTINSAQKRSKIINITRPNNMKDEILTPFVSQEEEEKEEEEKESSEE
jgi:hypothetical protein